MSDATVAVGEAIPEKVSSKHITGCLSASMSDDGEAAGIVFTVAGLDGAKDDKLLLTLPAEQVSWFRMIGHHLVLQQAQRAKAKGGGESKVMQTSMNPAGIEDIHVSDLAAPGAPPKVALGMNPGMPQEQVYIVSPLSAVKMAVLINMKMLSKLSEVEKEELRLFEREIKNATPLVR